MEGASRRALAALHVRFDALTARRAAGSAGSTGPTVDLERVSADLDAVAVLLRGELGLRRAFADAGVDRGGRVALADRLFADQLDPTALEIVRTAVGERWSRALDLEHALGELAAEALLARAQADGGLDEVTDELFRFARIVGGSPELSLALSDPALPASNKESLVGGLLAGKASPITIQLAQRAVAERDRGDVEPRIEALIRLAAARRHRTLAVARSARPLDEAQVERLRVSVSRYFDRDVELQVDVDPSLVGGVVVRVGDEVVDGSVARRLADARRRLLR